MTNRNSNARFELAPQVETERSTFDRSCNIKTSFDVGQLIPFYVDEVLPGDTFEISTSKVARLQTLITPVMDNLYLDTYYFFVPNRLVWDHWQEFCGENKTGTWYPDVEYTIPQVFPPSGSFDGEGNGWITGTIADYMGIPCNYDLNLQDEVDNTINALPFRAYALICNEWFRDENLQDPLYIPTGDATIVGSNGDNYVTDVVAGGKPFIACKYHDYFTSCLPSPQKGPDVSFLTGYAPVVGVANASIGTIAKTDTKPYTVANINTGNTVRGQLLLSNSNNGQMATLLTEEFGVNNAQGYFNNLFANLSDTRIPGLVPGTSVAASINQLRQAFQIQRLLEKDARGGTRYIEILKSHFGVTSPDARLQRPEYLGGNRVPLNIEQVLQTSETTDTTPQGNLAGWSQTNDYNDDVHKSFVEHGYIIGLMCARYDHSYQQGLNVMWKRKSRFDFYWPALAHLGEKPVYDYEIFWKDGNDITYETFGYQEAWAEYKYQPNYITGEMRSQYAQSLDFWHFADDYATVPQLSEEWIIEDKTNIDRCLAVSSRVSNQIFIDIMVKNKCTRPMPLYSIPGLIDHF